MNLVQIGDECRAVPAAYNGQNQRSNVTLFVIIGIDLDSSFSCLELLTISCLKTLQ